MAFGQDPEQVLLDLIAQANADKSGYINPLVDRMIAFGNSFAEEDSLLQTGADDLRRELQELAMQLSNGQDVTICSDIALEDAERIFTDRREYTVKHLVLTNFTSESINIA
jgi:hypothetical protein